jgi:ubiquinone/menaquinone biosynthesis C-methylase UbiE
MLGWLGRTLQSERLSQLAAAELEHYIALDRSPLPHPETREGYWGDKHLVYWLSGLSDYLVLSDFIAEHRGASSAPYSLLDFGCSSGRVLRHFAAYRDDLNLYANDANSNSVLWVRQHLPSSAVAFLNPIHPPLPLPDSSIDFAYAFSVFTHIDGFEESWLLELRRVLKPGGRLFLTVATERTWPLLAAADHFMLKTLLRSTHQVVGRPDLLVNQQLFRSPMPEDRVVILNQANPIKCLYTFHSSDYVRKRWGRLFKIERIILKAHGEHQDGILATKE